MIVYIYVLLQLQSMAMSSDEIKARALLEAKNLKNLRLSMTGIERLDLLKAKCQFETQAKKLPVSCYEKVMLNKKFLSLSEFNKTISKLDELCEESLIRSKVVKIPNHLSQHCKKIVETRNQELDYIEKEENPYGYAMDR